MTALRKWSVVLLCAATLLCGCDGAKAPPHVDHDDHDDHDGHVGEIHLSLEAMHRHGVRVEAVGRHHLAAVVSAPGRVAYNMDRIAHVGTPLAGRVVQIKATFGDAVRRGDVLLELDSPELGEAQSQFLMQFMTARAAQPAAELAGQAHERARALYEENQGIALAEVQRREAEWQAARSAQMLAKSAATAAENRLHLLGMTQEAVMALAETGEVEPRYHVRAPIDGTVVDREATLGELVGPEREALLVVADLSTLWVIAEAHESRIAAIRQGAAARLFTAEQGRQPATGTVAYIAPEVSPATRTIAARIEVANRDGTLRPGMFVRVEIETQAGGDAVLAIPDEAVQSVEGQPTVFVAVPGEPGAFMPRTVVLGEPVGAMIPIVSGIAEGEQVVVAGSFILKAELGKAAAEHHH